MSRRMPSASRAGRLARWAAATLACVSVAALTACGGSGAAAGSASGSSALKLTETTPKATGSVSTVRWALGRGEPTTIDPVKTGDYSPNTVVLNMCEPLMQLQPDFSIKPGLASSVAQPDATTMVFTIRSGVRFWDGHPLTAADVAYSLQRNLNPANQPVGAQLFRYVSSITATGPLQVTVTFTQHDAQFLQSMASVSSAVSEAAYVQKAGAAYGTAQGGLMCTGPFSFGRWTAGESITLNRNDDYWGTKAKAKKFEFLFFTDDSTLTSALLAGQVDGTYEAPLGSLSALRKSSTGTLYAGPSTESLSIGPVAASGPAADPRIRRALDLAIDKKALIKNVLRGAGVPQKTFTPPLVWAGDPAKSVYDAGYAALPATSTANLTKARALVKAAGSPTQALTLAVPSGDQLGLQTATIAAAAARKIGLRITLKQLQPTAFSALFYDPTKRQGIDFIVTTGYIEVPGAYYYAPAFVLKDGFFNWTGWSDPQVSSLIPAGQQSSDPQTAAKDFVAAQKVFAPADLQITLASTDELLYLKKSITGAPASFAYISSPWAASVGKA